MKFIKKFCLSLLFLILLLISFVFIWTSIPKKESDLNNFYIDDAFVVLKLTINQSNSSLLDEVIDFKFGEEFLVESFAQRTLFKLGGRYFAPLTVILFVDECAQNEKFNYSLLVKSKKLSRFLDIPSFIYTKTPAFNKDYTLIKYPGWLIWHKKTGTSGLESFAKYQDICFFTSDKKQLKELIYNLDSTEKVKSTNFQVYFRDHINKSFLLYLNDRKKILDYYLEKAKEKTSYNFFPTISDLDKLLFYLDKNNSAKKTYCKMDFLFKKGADFKKARKDVWFFSQVLKRIFEANFYQFVYEIKVVENNVIIEFNLSKRGRSDNG